MRDANAEASNRDTAGSANANCSMCSILALLWSGPKRVGAELTGSSLKQAIPCTDSTITQNSNIQYRRLCMSAAMRSQKRGLDGAKMALSGQVMMASKERHEHRRGGFRGVMWARNSRRRQITSRGTKRT